MDPDREMAAAMGFASFGTQPRSHSRKRQKISASDTETQQGSSTSKSPGHGGGGIEGTAADTSSRRKGEDIALHLKDQAEDDEDDQTSLLNNQDQEEGHEAQGRSIHQSHKGKDITFSALSSEATVSNPTVPSSLLQGNITNTNQLPNRPRQNHTKHRSNNRNGVWQGDEGGYYDESFIEDPWRALRNSR